jgi:hypothetical protein
MENTITVRDLIGQLLKQDIDKKVIVSSVGFNSSNSYDYSLDLEDLTVDEYKGVVRINFSNF